MAFKKAFTAKGFNFPDAHIEIVSCSLYRQSGKAHVYFRVYPTRQACLDEPQGNIIHEGELVIPFSGMAAALGAFYNALETKLLAQHPGAVAAQDAITFSQDPQP